MNKSDLIDYIAELEDVPSKAASKRIIDALVDKVVASIASGEDTSISGLGTFHVVTREAREGRNPQTGETIQIDTKIVPKFRASSKLKEEVNK